METKLELLQVLEEHACCSIPPTLLELARHFGVSKQLVANKVNRLIDKGWLKAVVPPGYSRRRAGGAVVTQEGRKALWEAGRPTRPKWDGPEYVHKKSQPPKERAVDYSDSQDPRDENPW